MYAYQDVFEGIISDVVDATSDIDPVPNRSHDVVATLVGEGGLSGPVVHEGVVAENGVQVALEGTLVSTTHVQVALVTAACK